MRETLKEFLSRVRNLVNKQEPIQKVVAVSGGFDPVHIGHLRMFEEAKTLGDKLVVIINCDDWLKRKKGKFFMTENDRAEIIKGFQCVDEVYILKSTRDDVVEALDDIRPDIFANGGDRKSGKDIPEYKFCSEYNIDLVFNVGGGKIRSSSDLAKNYENKKSNNNN